MPDLVARIPSVQGYFKPDSNVAPNPCRFDRTSVPRFTNQTSIILFCLKIFLCRQAHCHGLMARVTFHFVQLVTNILARTAVETELN